MKISLHHIIQIMWCFLKEHNSNYVVFLFLYHQPQTLDLSAVLGAGGHNVDPGGINAAVSQDIRQLRNILLNAVKSPGKELTEVVGKDLGRIDTRRLTQPLHLRPDIASVQGLAGSRHEDNAILNTAPFGIIQ